MIYKIISFYFVISFLWGTIGIYIFDFLDKHKKIIFINDFSLIKNILFFGPIYGFIFYHLNKERNL